MNIGGKKVNISLTLDEDVIKQIRELAEKDDRSVSQYINKVLKEHIQENDEL